MINNLGTPSSEQQINFGVLQIDTENLATEVNMLGYTYLLKHKIQMGKILEY